MASTGTSRTRAAGPSARSPERRVALLDHPLADYTLLLVITVALLGIGLVMVFSASSVESVVGGGSVFSQFQKQLLAALLGVPAMLWLSRRPLHFYLRVAPPLMVIALVLLVVVLIPGIGLNVGGQQNWIRLPGGFNVQPSEIAKLALALWGARLLSARSGSWDNWREVTIPFLPMAAAVVVLVLLEGDVGTALVFMPMIAVMLLVVGVPMRFFVVIGATLIAVITYMSLTEGYRMQRFATWLDPEADPTGAGWQVIHGRMALATGGWWGVGLGGSREKWGSLPEAHNDFIFAIIGEELGIVGTLTVLLLFLFLGLLGIRVALRTHSLFVRLATVAIVAWIVTQAMINIGAVIGTMPVTGVPLPLVSYGGTSLLFTLCAIGVLLAFARQEPAAAAAIRAASLQKQRSQRSLRRLGAKGTSASTTTVGDLPGAARD